MEISNTEIKKELLKQKPTAYFSHIRSGKAYYEVECLIINDRMTRIVFEIPVDDMGEADFTSNMSGNLLLRWIFASHDKGSWTELKEKFQEATDKALNTPYGQ